MGTKWGLCHPARDTLLHPCHKRCLLWSRVPGKTHFISVGLSQGRRLLTAWGQGMKRPIGQAQSQARGVPPTLRSCHYLLPSVEGSTNLASKSLVPISTDPTSTCSTPASPSYLEILESSMACTLWGTMLILTMGLQGEY